MSALSHKYIVSQRVDGMKENIKKLFFETDVTNYQIFKETGIAQTTLGRFTRKESDIGNMSLDNAIKLNE